MSETVRVLLDGTWHTLTRNTETGCYETVLTAPETLTHEVYPVRVQAVNNAGYQAVQDAVLTVRAETILPIATLTDPIDGAYVTDARTPIQFTLRDEENGSGIDLSTLSLTIDGEVYTQDSDGMACTEVDGGFDGAYTPPQALGEGTHTVLLAVCDKAGNAAPPVQIGFVTDTVPPVLTVIHPPDGLNTNKPMLTLTGQVKDETSGLAALTVNGEPVTVAADGTWSHVWMLTEGLSMLSIAATDCAGLTTTVLRDVLLDTVPPMFKSVHIAPDTEKPLGKRFVLTITLAPSAVSPKAIEHVQGTVNGESVTFTEETPSVWTVVLPRASTDEYVLELCAYDDAGNHTAYKTVFPCGMESKWCWDNREYINESDFNRIECNTAYMRDFLRQYGYEMPVVCKTDWTEFDFPKQGEIDRIRHNVDALQTGFYLLPDWREIVYDATLDATQVNALEWDLHALDVWLVRMTQAFCYSGEIFAGEVF